MVLDPTFRQSCYFRSACLILKPLVVISLREYVTSLSPIIKVRLFKFVLLILLLIASANVPSEISKSTASTT